MNMRVELSDVELMGYIGQQESQDVLSASNDNVIDAVSRFLKSSGLRGDRIPWEKASNHAAFGSGELSLWAGINGHGKTQMLYQVMTEFLERGRRVLIASMEMDFTETLANMTQQAAGCFPSDRFQRDWLKAQDSKLFVYNRKGRVPLDCVIGLTHYAKTLGINHLVVDSLTMCGVGREDYDRQAEFVNELRAAAKMAGLHVHLVCHMRKGESERKRPNKFDIRGAGEITDMADKVFIVWRNKVRENELSSAAYQNRAPEEKIASQYGVYLALEKNRQDGHEGVFGLYYDAQSKRFEAEQ